MQAATTPQKLQASQKKHHTQARRHNVPASFHLPSWTWRAGLLTTSGIRSSLTCYGDVWCCQRTCRASRTLCAARGVASCVVTGSAGCVLGTVGGGTLPAGRAGGAGGAAREGIGSSWARVLRCVCDGRAVTPSTTGCAGWLVASWVRT